MDATKFTIQGTQRKKFDLHRQNKLNVNRFFEQVVGTQV